MELKNHFTQDNYGNKLPDATGSIYLAGTNTLATGIVDASGNPMSNPTTSGPGALIQFAAPNGKYDLVVTKDDLSYSLRIQCNDVEDTTALIDDMRENTQAYSIDALQYVGQTQILTIQAQQAALESGEAAEVKVNDLEAEFASEAGASKVGATLSLPGSISRSIQDFIKDFLPTIEFFGGKGDYVTDNLLPMAKAIASGAKGVKFGMGIYGFSNAFDKPQNFIMIGEVAPELGFGTVDAKQFLREGYRHLMPGTVLAFKGTGTLTASFPQRSDEFSTVRYCVRSVNTGIGSLGATIRDLAIIQDMVCFTPEGVSTKPGFENKADYEVGHLFDDSAQEVSSGVVVFGYFPKAGTVVMSSIGNDDPDYNKFIGGSTMGKHGLAILGSSTPASHGLSGTAGHNFKMYSLDHHSRGSMTTEERIAYYADANTWSCLYIDGDVDASSAEINGHYFYDCVMRTRANTPLRLGKASNVQFYGGVCEISPYGITNSDVPVFIGSADVKRGVGFYGMRNNYLTTIFNPQFVGLIPVPVIVSGDPLNGRFGVFCKTATGYAGTVIGSDGNVGNPSVQFTKDANNGSADWLIRMNTNSSDVLEIKHATQSTPAMSITTAGIRTYGAGSRTEVHEVGGALAIVSDAVTVTRSIHAVTPESGNTDDLVTINGGVEGMELIIRPTSSAHTITVKRTGNIRLDGSTDKVLVGSLSRIRLIYLSGLWSQLGPVVTNG